MTELCFPSLVSAEKFFFFKIHFLVLDLKVQQAKKSPACYCMSPEAAETVKVGAAAAAALVFTTRSNFICRSQFWHFHWNVPRGMFGVTFRMVCDALYGPSATTQCPNWLHSFVLVQFCLAEREFCAILHQFPILAAFLHRTIFLRTQLHSCARAVHRRLNAPQCSWHCHFHVNNPLNICANDRALVHNIWPPMCTCTQCAHVNYIYVLMALRLLCAPLPWWTIC